MPPRRASRFSDTDIHAPDPLAFSGNQDAVFKSPIRPTSKPFSNTTTTLEPTFLRGLSPKKTLIIDPEVNDGGTPYRIRVTVQAEPRNEQQSPIPYKRLKTLSPSPRKTPSRAPKTVTVPLRDPDDATQTPRRGRGRPPIRSGTPAVKKVRPAQRKSLTNKDRAEWYDDDWNPAQPLSSPPLAPVRKTTRTSPRKTGRPRKASPFGLIDDVSDQSLQDEILPKSSRRKSQTSQTETETFREHENEGSQQASQAESNTSQQADGPKKRPRASDNSVNEERDGKLTDNRSDENELLATRSKQAQSPTPKRPTPQQRSRRKQPPSSQETLNEEEPEGQPLEHSDQTAEPQDSNALETEMQDDVPQSDFSHIGSDFAPAAVPQRPLTTTIQDDVVATNDRLEDNPFQGDAIRRTPPAEKWARFSTLPPRTDERGQLFAQRQDAIQSNDDGLLSDHGNGMETSNDYNDVDQDGGYAPYLQPLSDDFDADEAADMIDHAPTIGDETMMKSMDMTMVSTSELYSKLDVHSSLLQATPASTNQSRSNAKPTKDKPSPQYMKALSNLATSALSAILPEARSESPQSSPHVRFSSPLVSSSAEVKPTRARSKVAELRPSRLSPAPDRSILRSRSPAQHLPTPDSDEKPAPEEEDVAIPERRTPEVDEVDASSGAQGHSLLQSQKKEDRWQRDREEVIYQAQKVLPDEVVEIDDNDDDESEIDSEYRDNDEGDGEDVNQDNDEGDIQDDANDDDGSEAEDGDNDAEDEADHHPMSEAISEGDVDLWQQAGEQSSHSLEDSRLSNRSTAASRRVAQREQLRSSEAQSRLPKSDNSMNRLAATQRRHISSEDNPIRRPIAEKENDEVSALFRAVGQKDYARSSVEVQDQTMDQSSDEEISSSRHEGGDLSAMLRRRVTNMMDDSEFSFAKSQPFRRNNMAKPKEEKPNGIQQVQPPPLRHQSPPILPHSPRRSSPLKHRLESDEEESSVAESSMASDIRQLQNDFRAIKRPMLEKDKAQRLESPKRKPRRSLLKLTQMRQARRAMQKSPERSQVNDSSIGNSLFSFSGVSETPDTTEQSGIKNVVNRVFSFIPSSSNEATETHMTTFNPLPPSRPTHRLLCKFRMLPKAHPWTDNHFQSMLSLYKHWLRHEDLYDPSHPSNAGLFTPRWQQYVGMEFSNWGYSLKLSASLVVVAALFQRLLLLDNGAAFEALYGDKMRLGVVAERTLESGAISEWHVVLRLFTVVVGDLIRADEAKGVVIDRTPALKWRFGGQWLWRRGWCAGLL